MTHTDNGPTAIDAIDELATRFFAAIEAGDSATVEACYDPAAEIWHNHDNVVQTVADNLRTLNWLATALTDVRYTDIRRRCDANGFVQEHVLRLTNQAGQPVELAACIVTTVVGGRITRLNEYLDSAAVARVRATS